MKKVSGRVQTQYLFITCRASALTALQSFQHAGWVIVRGDQQLSQPGYQAPVLKANWCGNERQERSYRRKGRWEKTCSYKFIYEICKSSLSDNTRSLPSLVGRTFYELSLFFATCVLYNVTVSFDKTDILDHCSCFPPVIRLFNHCLVLKLL